MTKKSASQIKAVIFDCDGVMFDSSQANKAYYNRMLKEFNKAPLTEKDFTFVHMSTVNQALLRLFPAPKELEAAHAFKKTLSYHPFIKLMQMEEGLVPLLEHLKPSCITAISTNRSDTMDAVLEEFHLKDFFHMVVTSLDVSKPKPDPESITKILDAFKIPPDSAIYIGDALVDEKAATGAGVKFISYKNQSLIADYHVVSFREVRDILEEGLGADSTTGD